MEIDPTLYKRVIESDTETPRACHIIALTLAGRGAKIPDDVRDAILSSAERGRDELAEKIEFANLLASKNLSLGILRANFLDLAASIAFSYGIDGPKACTRRLEHIHTVLYADETEEGVGFTE